jgi:hypothetical protein
MQQIHEFARERQQPTAKKAVEFDISGGVERPGSPSVA